MLKHLVLKMNHFFIHLEQMCIYFLFLGLISGSLLQIILRTFFDTGFTWLDPLLRASLIFITMIGACVAISQKKHIQMDFIKYLLPKRYTHYTYKTISALAASLCFFCAYLGYLFVKSEMEFMDPFVLNIKMYHIQSIFPVCFSIMGYHFICEILTVSDTSS